MTKEELEKEAEKNILNLKNNSIKVSGKPFQINEGDYTQGYLDSAEPREKRIAELEQTNKKISDECHKLVDTLEKKQKEIIELEKENAELKEQNYKTKVALRNVIDYLGQFCSDYPDCVIEAEQFLKDNEVEND